MFLSVPLKKTKEIDVSVALKHYISSSISTNDNPEDCTNEINEFNKLRNNAVCKALDKTDGSLEILYRYYDQLDAMDIKMPFDENHVPQAFRWKSAFETSSLFASKSTLTMVSGQYEKACVLFNIGALQSQIACNQNLDVDSNLKNTVKYFQMSSGVFQNLKETIVSRLPADATLDLTPDCLGALSTLMLAQAQEVFIKKARDDNKKPAVIAKLAQQCQELYGEALRQMSTNTLKGLWEKEWLSIVGAKQNLMTAMTEYYKAQEVKVEKKFGEELSRLAYAGEQCKAANQKAASFVAGQSAYRDLVKMVEAGLETAKKENDFIYHERIMAPKELGPVDKAVLARPIAPTFPLTGPEFEDLFHKIVPIPVNQASAVFETRKSEVVNGHIAKLRQATQNLNGFLVSQNLPAALEDLGNASTGFSGKKGTKTAGVPRSLLDKSNAIKRAGGLGAIEKSMQELPLLLARNKEILAEDALPWTQPGFLLAGRGTNDMLMMQENKIEIAYKFLIAKLLGKALHQLDEELSSDAQLRKQFGSKWIRTPSDKLQAPLREEAKKYSQIIDSAIHADEIVKSKFTQHRQIMELLCHSENDLAKSIPASVGGLKSDLPVVKELKILMEQVETLKAERETIEFEFQHAKTPDMNQRFIKAFSKSGTSKIAEKEISDEVLIQTYGELEKQAALNLKTQDELIEKIQVANLALVQEKSKDPSFDAKRRDTFLQELAAAYDSYTEISANLKEGMKFYNDLTPILLKYQNKCSDLCFARKTERDELIKDMQDQIVNQPAHSYVSPYSGNAGPGQNPNSTDGPHRPPRPPPPSIVPSEASIVHSSYVPTYSAQPTYGTYPGAQAPPAPFIPAMPSGFNPYMTYQQPYTLAATNQGYSNTNPQMSYPTAPYPLGNVAQNQPNIYSYPVQPQLDNNPYYRKF